MSKYVDDAPVGEEPMTDQERRDLKVEREVEEYADMYETVRSERKEAGLQPNEVQVCAETMRRLREKYRK